MVSTNGTQALEDPLEDNDFHTALTEEAYEELASLEGSSLVGISFWDSSLADELEEELPSEENRSVIDIDLYLEDNVLLELYGATLYPSAEGDPLVGVSVLEKALVDMVDGNGVLDEVAETSDGALVLVLTGEEKRTLYLTVGAWVVGEWEEVPEE